MSTWVDKLVTDFTITTGDGKVFTPLSLYLTYNLRYDFNIAKFDFKDVRGTLVKRGEAQGEVYNINVVFMGGDNLDLLKEFKESSKNPGAWTIQHPFYGTLYVQPIYLEYDNAKLNQTVITGEVMETLKDDRKAAKNSFPDAVEADMVKVHGYFGESLDANVPDPQPDFFAQVESNINGIYGVVHDKMTSGPADAMAYQSYYDTAVNSLASTAYSDTAGLIGDVQNLTSAPAYFSNSVANRLAIFKNQLDYLRGSVESILATTGTPTKPLKKLYETNAAAAIAAMCLATATNVTTDYDYRPNVLDIIGTVVAVHNAYISDLNSLQTENGGDLDSYIPDSRAVNGITELVKATVSYLYTLADNALQQRVYVVPATTNLILIGFELYPTLAPDDAAQLVVANNDISTKECLAIEKDRRIIYYV